MKKVICFLVFVITAFLIVFCFMNNGLKSTEKLELGKAFCESIISDLEQGEVTIEEKYTNRGQISRYVEYLKESDSAIINLSSYFDINMNESLEAGNPEDSGLTEEELEDLRNRLNSYKSDFKEDSSIFVDEDGNKCIKVNDLRRLDNLDGVVNYVNGEYVIPVKDIPITFTNLKKNDFFNFKLTDVVEVNKNVLSFKYENTSNEYSSIFIFDIYFNNKGVTNFVLTINGYNPFSA